MYVLNTQSHKSHIEINNLREILQTPGYVFNNQAPHVVSFHHSNDISLTQLHVTFFENQFCVSKRN